MRVIDIGIEKIDRIYHISDVHVRNVKRHTEYKQVFKRLYSYIRKTKTDKSVIYLAGDIVHAKTDMSPELVDIVSDFFRQLADLAPTILITGNHDCNLNNSYRLDALSPIVSSLNHPDLHYLKDNGVYKISNVHFNVMSIFDLPADYIKASDFEGEYKIALHHGAVHNAATDTGMVLSNTHVTVDMFEGHDLTLLGDIHKMQFLDDAETIAYAGSLIQQNHGEALEHGILVWDLKTSTSEFVEIPNDYGYYTLHVDNGHILNRNLKLPKKPRLRLKVKDTDAATIKTLIADLRTTYKVQDIAIQKVSELTSTESHKKIGFSNVRDVEWQNDIISEYLTVEYGLDKDLLDAIRHINRTVHSKIPEKILTRNVTWNPRKFEFSNMFSYGEGNVIDFTDFYGLYGLFAPNATGKSTLLDSLAFCCFDQCSRTKYAKHVLNNKKTSFYCKFEFVLGKYTYFIERRGTKQKNGHVPVKVDFWRIDEQGNTESLNGDQRDSTNKVIQQYLGTYDDFILTALSLQNNNTGFIDKSQRQRKELLSQFLDIEIFEQQYQIGGDESRETAALIREYKRRDFSTDLSNAKADIKKYSDMFKRLSATRDEHINLKDSVNDLMMRASSELRPINENIQDPEEITESLNSLNESIIDTEAKIVNAEQQLRDAELSLESKRDELSNTNYDEIDLLIAEKSSLQDLLTDLGRDRYSIIHEIQHAEKMVSKLEVHQWDEDCEYCMANPWLHETKTAADQLPDLIERKNGISKDVETAEARLDEINNIGPSEMLTAIHKLEKDVLNIERTISDRKGILERKQWELSSQIATQSELMQKLEMAKAYAEDLQFNKEKEAEIETMRSEIDDLDHEILEISDQLMEVSGKLKIAEKTKEDAEASIQRLKDLEIQNKGYEYYQKAVSRNGVPYYLISKALPEIEAEINNILLQIVDFSIILKTDGKNINGYIVYDEENFWPLELTSGMEKFISSLAIRTSLINISSLPRPNFIAIDEGFGVLDSDNLNSMFMLFEYMKNQFGFMLCISHIDAMRDIVDQLIEIKKINGYSKIEFT